VAEGAGVEGAPKTSAQGIPKELLASVGSDLIHLFDTSRVSEDIQRAFYEAGVGNVKEFGAMFESTAHLRELLASEFKLDEKSSLAARVKVSKVVVAWEAARVRKTKQAELDGEAEIREQPKKVCLPDYFAMRAAYEEGHGALTDDQVPGKTFMEKRLEMIEKGDFRAEPLSEVLSLEDDEGDTLRAVFTPSGQLEAVRIGKKVPMPMTTEELRMRMAIYGRSWVMAASLHTHRPYLKDATPLLWDKYVGYLLGKFVLGLVSSGPAGSTVSSPSWSAVLHYDVEVRKQAMRNLLAGMTMGEALQKAMDCPVTRERFFTTPLALAHLKRGGPQDHIADASGQGVSNRSAKKARKEAAKKTQPAAAPAAQKTEGERQSGKGGKGEGEGEGPQRTSGREVRPEDPRRQSHLLPLQYKGEGLLER